VANLAEINNKYVVALSEIEVPATAAALAIDGYTLFCPHIKKGDKTRVLILVTTELAVRSNARLAVELMLDCFPSVWVRLDAHEIRGGGRVALCGAVLVGAIYRQWAVGGLAAEKVELDLFRGQIDQAVTTSKSVIFTGDMNLDVSKSSDPGYRRKTMLAELQELMSEAGFEYHVTPFTWTLYGLHTDGGGAPAHRKSTINHTYSTGVRADVTVLHDGSSDHRSMVINITAGAVHNETLQLSIVHRRNFKGLERPLLEEALLQYDWGGGGHLPAPRR
jgi:hypothetical protein